MNENKISTLSSQLEQPFQLRRDALGNLAGLSSSWISGYDPINKPRENFLGADFQGRMPICIYGWPLYVYIAYHV